MIITTQSPFPPEGLQAAYEWHRRTSTCISGESHTLPEFVALIHGCLLRSDARSWGISVDGVLSGMVIFDPIYRVTSLVDGSIHIALARRAWGKGIIQEVSRSIIPQLFTEIPTLQRLTGFTPHHYRASLAVGEALGFQREGVMRDAVTISGRTRDIIISGLTRTDYGAI